jgi:hypothetical protein
MSYRTDLIAKPLGGDDVRHPNGNTGDIIETVLFADAKAAYYTKKFAATLKGNTMLQTCNNIHRFIKTQIQYSLDPTGLQLIKSPGRLWQENKKGNGNYRGGDCKSFSVFTASILQNLGMPYGYRFASYTPGNSTPTHVYVYVPHSNGEIIIDAVWDGPFNTQKPFTYKDDRQMKKGEAVGGINKTVLTKPGGFLQY